jgi:hypothetical protein
MKRRIKFRSNLNTTDGFGKVNLSTVMPYSPNNNFYGRAIRYNVLDWNRFGERL